MNAKDIQRLAELRERIDGGLGTFTDDQRWLLAQLDKAHNALREVVALHGAKQGMWCRSFGPRPCGRCEGCRDWQQATDALPACEVTK